MNADGQATQGGRDIPGGLFHLFRWTRSFAHAGTEDDIVAVTRTILLSAPEAFHDAAGRSDDRGGTSFALELVEAVLTRRDLAVGFRPSQALGTEMRLLAGNLAGLKRAGSRQLAERDGQGRVPAFVGCQDVAQAIGASGALFLDLDDPDEAPDDEIRGG